MTTWLLILTLFYNLIKIIELYYKMHALEFWQTCTIFMPQYNHITEYFHLTENFSRLTRSNASSHPPLLWTTTIDWPHKQILPFLGLNKNIIAQCVLLSLALLILAFFEIYPYLALLAVLSFLLLNSNLLHGYSTIFFSIHLLMDILSYFQVITFINKGAMYVWVQVFMWKCIFFSLE